ncbi:hypothetical protein C8J56DRAFT_1066400 [Mycena floridula]|nr:hypothetical protein C8J56DRAFT_1066400 [Mycena floridula]
MRFYSPFLAFSPSFLPKSSRRVSVSAVPVYQLNFFLSALSPACSSICLNDVAFAIPSLPPVSLLCALDSLYRKISMARGGKATAKKSPAKSKTKPKPTTICLKGLDCWNTGSSLFQKNASPVDSDAEYGIDKDLFNSSLNEKYKTPPGPYTKRLRNTITPSKNATTGIVQAAKNRRAAVPAPTATSADEQTPTRGRSAARNQSSSPVPGPSGVRVLSQPSAPSNSEFGIPVVSKFQANRQGSYDPAFGLMIPASVTTKVLSTKLIAKGLTIPASTTDKILSTQRIVQGLTILASLNSKTLSPKPIVKGLTILAWLPSKILRAATLL